MKAIVAGEDHSLALLADGTVMGWGTNRFGQVGDGTTELRKTPVPVVGVRNAVGVAAGSRLSAGFHKRGSRRSREPRTPLDNIFDPTQGFAYDQNTVDNFGKINLKRGRRVVEFVLKYYF